MKANWLYALFPCASKLAAFRANDNLISALRELFFSFSSLFWEKIKRNLVNKTKLLFWNSAAAFTAKRERGGISDSFHGRVLASRKGLSRFDPSVGWWTGRDVHRTKRGRGPTTAIFIILSRFFEGFFFFFAWKCRREKESRTVVKCDRQRDDDTCLTSRPLQTSNTFPLFGLCSVSKRSCKKKKKSVVMPKEIWRRSKKGKKERKNQDVSV